jgi:hypothetical protein
VRLQLTACALLLWTSVAFADGRAASLLSVYSDDDGLTVISPQVSVRAEVQTDVHLEAAYDVDIITAASVDVVTAASPRGYSEERHGFRLGSSWAPRPDTKIAGYYMPSFEPDYQSHGIAAFASREWIDRRLTTRLDVRMNFDRVGRAGDDKSNWQTKTTSVVGLGLGWILDANTIAALSYELQLLNGFMASPYRYVDIVWEDMTNVAVPEAVPGERTRHAIAANVRRALPGNFFASATYRFYTDTWGILSHTGEVEVQHSFESERVIAALGVRGYLQNDADFYQEVYETEVGLLPEHRASDKSLAKSWSILGGGRLEMSYRPKTYVDVIRGAIKVEVYDQRFANFAWLDERRALVASLGLSAEF